MGEISEAKSIIHEAVQRSCADAAMLEGGLVVRWVLVCELALPDASSVLLQLDNCADGSDMSIWEVEGLLFHSLKAMPNRSNRRRHRDDD